MDGDNAPYTVDIDAMCSDYVKQAEIITGFTESDASRLLFVKAAAIAVESTEDTQIVMIECQSRDHLVASIRDEAIVDPSGLDKVVIKYTPTFDMLRALLAAWHCGLSTDESPRDAMDSEAGFLVWDENERAECKDLSTPDYLFVDGIGAVTSDTT
ncbi:hypothetical protein GGH94_003852 [Coemansia aciculifera]|uniref:Uncharacterized protein n=1 Tax=Coemansia aciculifera TaxID=417176 RepID=A0A9W8IJA2_9FUNG|nr:hypothetical protein GGH94_003852 [Coemansia aciculifera]KAJ2873502.1 hypothetical protein GGH93_003168 [Coemansia aciculifera]